jgi:hypothetical protein
MIEKKPSPWIAWRMVDDELWALGHSPIDPTGDTAPSMSEAEFEAHVRRQVAAKLIAEC